MTFCEDMTKAQQNIMHEQVLIPDGSSIRVKWDDFPHFTFPWHFHNEIEIVYVIRSHGTRYVADSVEPFCEGDLVMVGSNVPHYWKNDNAYYKENSGLRVNAIVIQIIPEFMEKPINSYPEMAHIKKLLTRADQGLHFSKSFSWKIGKQLTSLCSLKGFERFSAFLNVLDKMARTSQYRLLASPDFRHNITNVHDDRLNKILNYIKLNYTEKILLAKLARQFEMNPSSFSRYFKLKTGKTLIEYINELRIRYACKLLQDNNYTISQICFKCGFNNISNFNRFFKEKMKITPKEYIETN